ncbi:hypothetical protein [Motiliproteus sp. SC1-56]|uniref:hypothetical protein n=1 Tax=Motiliproteus sp. SC1-56 TaxID=2799565 RepID=UPI001A8FE4B3|nr:hypothetical protein [Motiliproteus sp. SC1-56]
MRALFSFIGRHWCACSLLLLSTVTLLSLWPLDSLPPVPGSDKTHHLIAYAAVAFPAALARPRAWGLWLLSFWGWSGLIELAQPWANRYGEWLDLAANGVGIVIGFGFAWLCRRWPGAVKRPIS